VKKECDAYIGSTWGQYYFAAPGAAWARATDEPWEKTLRVRLPCALAAAVGVGLMAGLLAILLRRRVSLSLRAVAAFLVIQAVSVSLLLHLPEARYYPLTTLLVAACLFLRWNLLDPFSQRGSRPAAWVWLSCSRCCSTCSRQLGSPWFEPSGSTRYSAREQRARLVNSDARARSPPHRWLCRPSGAWSGFFDTLGTTQRILASCLAANTFSTCWAPSLSLRDTTFCYGCSGQDPPRALVPPFSDGTAHGWRWRPARGIVVLSPLIRDARGRRGERN
jgi:hypothetical protein